MAPLSQALALELLQPHTGASSSKQTYHGIVDPEWVIAKTPNGGYVLSLLVKACMKFQENSKHRDPVHVTAHFMLPATVSNYQIEVEVVHSGSRFTNLQAKWTQDGKTKVIAPVVFGTLPEFDAPPSSKKFENIPPSHPLYHRIPIVSHPSTCRAIHISSKHYGFLKHIQHAEDPAISQRNKSKLTAPPDTHAGGLESGLWMELTNEDEELGLAVIPVFADLYRRTPSLLSEACGDGILITRYPTVLITLEFKCQLPRRATPGYADPAKLEYTVEVEVVRTGSRFTNLIANLVQDGKTRVMTHMIFGTLPAFDAPPSNQKHENIPPSHPLYHSIPILSHPSKALIEIVRTNYFKFRKHLRRADDPAIIARNQLKLAAPPGTDDGGIESGLWVELTGEDEELGLGMLPLFADVFQNPPAMLAELEGERKPAKWYPTMLITIEFKRQFPRRATPGFSKRTLGVHSKCLFLEHGRHDIRCEIWSAPCNPGEPGGRDPDDESWKREMKCVAVTGQVALTSLIEVKKGSSEKAKL
ncbi:hypothetical protein FRC06_008612 [Ceratobasidium sp. 370]|nr:hypothetical protein FRC06_008612 [Ceratobasidium sp. 370]